MGEEGRRAERLVFLLFFKYIFQSVGLCLFINVVCLVSETVFAFGASSQSVCRAQCLKCRFFEADKQTDSHHMEDWRNAIFPP